MQRPTRGGEAEQPRARRRPRQRPARRHRRADRRQESDRADGGDARRQDVPDEHVLDLERGVGGGGDAAGQHARQAVGEKTRGMAGEMAEEFATHIACHLDEGLARDPARDAPQEIVGGHAQHENGEGKPETAAPPGPSDRMSTRNLTPYCVLTEQPRRPARTAGSRRVQPDGGSHARRNRKGGPGNGRCRRVRH